MGFYENKKVIVTGGAGFVGSNLVKRLVQEGAEVSVIDNLETGYKSNLNDAWNDIEFIDGSVYHGEMDTWVENVQTVFHLAAKNIIASTHDPYGDMHINIGGTLNILLAIKKLPIRLVYTSSASVYGNPRYLPINEDDQINLLTPYAVSKYAGEGYCSAFYESYGVESVILRLSNVYGPYQRPENRYCGVVAKFMQSVKEGKPMLIHGSGEQTRDFTYVDDVIDALLIAGENPRAVGEVFNIASGVETSVEKLAESLICYYAPDAFDFKDSKTILEHIDRRDIDNISRRTLNIEKARRKLGWIPKTQLWEGLAKTWEWMNRES